MKLKNLFYLLLAAPLAFAACEETPEPEPQPEPQPEVKEPKLTLTSDATMEFAAIGGEGVITYTLENAVEGTELTATCEAEWVANVTAGETVTFVVDENEATEARETKVVVAYGELSFEVAVKQAAKAEAPKTPVFELTSDQTMEFTQDGQYGLITFNLENAVAGVEVTAKSNASWVKNFAVRQADGEIAFEVEANTGAAREAKITATYGMLEFKVTVKQAEYVAPAPELIIDGADEEFEAAGDSGVIEFHVKNAVEGVEATATTVAEWITINSVAEGVVNFTVAANETDAVREGVITIAYGEISQNIKIKQYFDGYNPDLQYSAFEVVEVFAESEQGGKQWNVTFIEHDTVLGDMQTIISFELPEASAQRVTDGTYSVANGGILVNTANNNSYSTYRANASIACDITTAEFTVVTDTEAKTISFVGTFQAGIDIVTLNYTGEVRGMDLSDGAIKEDMWTEWSSVKKNWNDKDQFMFTATSADGSLVMLIDILHSGSNKVCPAGTYQVSDWSWQGDVLENTSKITYNSVEAYMKEGYIIVEHIAGGYKFTFDITDANGRNFKGIIEGPVEGASNPA